MPSSASADLTVRHHACVQPASFAIGINLRRDGTIERPCADAFTTQALITVKPKGAFELRQFKLGLADFQARLVSVEVDQNFRLYALFKRDIEINTAFE